MKDILILTKTTLVLGLFLSSSIVYADKKGAAHKEFSAKSEWISDFYDNTCRIHRKFSDGGNDLFLAISRFSPDHRFEVALAGAQMQAFSKGKLTIQFGPNELAHKIETRTAKLANGSFALISAVDIGVEPMSRANLQDDNGALPTSSIGAEREKAITFLEVKLGKKSSVRLLLGPMDQPFSMLQKCFDDMLLSWGFDAEVHKNLRRLTAPNNNAATWVTTNDYPSKMLNQGLSAVVGFRLDVDENGIVGGCHILKSAGKAEFDDAVCRAITKRARFNPAMDANGKPVRSFWRSKITFTTW